MDVVVKQSIEGRYMAFSGSYELTDTYKKKVEEAGMLCSGTSPDGKLVEIVELKNHPYFIAGQFHPELKSRPNRPAPLFMELVHFAKEHRHKNN